jgi:diketogulonate reductase-like aldo/keto reductase
MDRQGTDRQGMDRQAMDRQGMDQRGMNRRGPTPRAVPLAGGVVMPLVGLGTWQLRGRSGYRAMRSALELGYRHLDTATMYGNEAEVGRAVRDSGLARGDVFVTTKLDPRDAGRERQVLEASLRALGSDYVDLWLIHAPPWRDTGLASWRELLAARERGQVRAAGVSNYDLAQLDLLTGATGAAPQVNQIPWSPDRHDPELLAGHRDRTVVLEGYSPLKGTRLDGPVLVETAARHQVTPAQVVLRWHLEHRIPVIPKSADPDRLAANLDLFGFSLSADEVARIEAR